MTRDSNSDLTQSLLATRWWYLRYLTGSSSCWFWRGHERSAHLRRPSSLGWAHRFVFVCMDTLLGCNLLHRKFLVEPRHHILPLNSINFWGRVLLNKIVDMHEATANSNFDLVSLFNLNVDTFLPELVHSFWFSQEEYLHLLFFWVCVQVSSKRHVNSVWLMADVNRLIAS